MIHIETDSNIGYYYDETINRIRDYSAEMINSKLDWSNPQIGQISIEMINRCNGECSFCPANRHVDTRKMLIMDDMLLEKIVKDIKQMNYMGQVCLSINNEPLLDPSFVNRVKYIRKELKNNRIVFYTNGTLFNGEKMKDLLAITDQIIIDNYSNGDERLSPNLKNSLLDNYKAISDSNCEVSIVMQNPSLVKLNRGGQAPNRRESNISWHHMCARPFWEFSIVPNGDVIVCCHDVYSKIVLGNVRENSISEIWNSDSYVEFRKAMAQGKRDRIPMCRECDQVSVRTPNNAGEIYYAIKNVLLEKIKEGYTLEISEEDSRGRLIEMFCKKEGILLGKGNQNRRIVIASEARFIKEFRPEETFTIEEGLEDIMQVLQPFSSNKIISLKKVLRSMFKHQSASDEFYEFIVNH